MKNVVWVILLAFAAQAQTYERRDYRKMSPAIEMGDNFKVDHSQYSELSEYQRFARARFENDSNKLALIDGLASNMKSDPEGYLEKLKEAIGVEAFEDAGDFVQTQIDEQINFLLSMVVGVRWFAPEDQDSIFDWKGDRSVLKDKKVSIQMVRNEDPIVDTMVDHSRETQVRVSDLNAATALMYDAEKGICWIKTYVFLESILSSDQVQAAALVALAHEILGNVQIFLERPCQDWIDEKPTKEARVEREIRSFEAAIAYIGRLQSSSYYRNDMDASFRSGIEAELAREKAGLASWKSQKK